MTTPIASARPCRWAPCCSPAGRRETEALPNAKILLHQVSGGFEGQATDIEIQAREVISVRRRLEEIIALQGGQPLEKVSTDMGRDCFLSAEEAKEYGIIGRVIAHR